jgi:hypothetical protein
MHNSISKHNQIVNNLDSMRPSIVAEYTRFNDVMYMIGMTSRIPDALLLMSLLQHR